MGLLLIPLLLASCSNGSGSKGSGPSKPAACAYVTKLDEIAGSVAAANVHDPVSFNATLEQAVKQYVATVRALRGVAPADLHASLDRVEADVQQERFDSALTDRAQLDAFAQRECGRLATTATTGSPTPTSLTPTSPTTGLAPGASTTVPTASTAPPTSSGG